MSVGIKNDKRIDGHLLALDEEAEWVKVILLVPPRDILEKLPNDR